MLFAKVGFSLLAAGAGGSTVLRAKNFACKASPHGSAMSWRAP
jgi:hypothetical protein